MVGSTSLAGIINKSVPDLTTKASGGICSGVTNRASHTISTSKVSSHATLVIGACSTGIVCESVVRKAAGTTIVCSRVAFAAAGLTITACCISSGTGSAIQAGRACKSGSVETVVGQTARAGSSIGGRVATTTPLAGITGGITTLTRSTVEASTAGISSSVESIVRLTGRASSGIGGGTAAHTTHT